VQHQNLAAAVRTRTDANDRDVQGLRDLRAQRCRHQLEHQHRRARVLQFARLAQQRRSTDFVATLDTPATERMHRLRRQAQVRAHRNAAFGQALHRLRRPATALKLDHVRTRLHQDDGTGQGLSRCGVVTAIGQIANQPGGAIAARNAGHVIGHVGQRDRHRAGVTLDHHAE
jgi:hypothetical protein